MMQVTSKGAADGGTFYFSLHSGRFYKCSLQNGHVVLDTFGCCPLKEVGLYHQQRHLCSTAMTLTVAIQWCILCLCWAWMGKYYFEWPIFIANKITKPQRCRIYWLTLICILNSVVLRELKVSLTFIKYGVWKRTQL